MFTKTAGVGIDRGPMLTMVMAMPSAGNAVGRHMVAVDCRATSWLQIRFTHQISSFWHLSEYSSVKSLQWGLVLSRFQAFVLSKVPKTCKPALKQAESGIQNQEIE
jgi:hypothetical protein